MSEKTALFRPNTPFGYRVFSLMEVRMNTKLMAALAVLLFVAPFSWAGGSSDKTGGLFLQDAIEQTGEKIAGELPKGSRVAIVAFESVNDNLSDYIMEELTGALFDRGIEVADRQNLEYVYKELNLQMSGDVSDESAKSIGKFLAADMVITGQLLDLDGMYRYRTSAINVETAVRASVTRLNVRSDNETRRMINALANQRTTVKAAKYGVSENSTPQTAGTFLDRGIMHASRGEYERAIADFTEAIRLDPNMSAAYMLRGRALAASVSRVTSIAENFASFNAITRAGNVTAEQSRVYDQSIADFNQAIRLDPNLTEAFNDRGRAYSNKGDYDRAIADYNQVIRLDPNLDVAFNNRGLAYERKGDNDRAIADFEAALRIDPNYARARNNLEQVRQRRGR
jgi:tetratricopeptide (TPR) repeat protein